MARTYGFLAASAAVLLAAGLAACNSQGTTAQTGRLERQGSVPTTTAAAVPADYRRVEDKTLVVQPFNMTVDKIHRMDVVTSNGEQIGDINHVLVDRSGRVTAMTITSGGVLGNDHYLGRRSGPGRPRTHRAARRSEAAGRPLHDLAPQRPDRAAAGLRQSAALIDIGTLPHPALSSPQGGEGCAGLVSRRRT
jgi:hypothetical protein